MHKINKQSGITAIGMLIIIGLIAFFTLITLRLAPLYLENFKVVSSLESLKNEPELAVKPGPEIVQLLMKRLDINDVDNVGPQNIEVRRLPNGVIVAVKYEVRKEMVGNIDIVGKFDKSVKVTTD